MRFVFLLLALFITTSSVFAADAFRYASGVTAESYLLKMSVPILEEAYRRNGRTITVTELPSRRSLVAANRGNFDGDLFRVEDLHKVAKNQFPNLVKVESVLLSGQLVGFALKPISMEYKDHLRVAYKAGVRKIKRLTELEFPNNQITATPELAQAFTMLAFNRVDLVIAERFQAKQILSNYVNENEIKEVVEFTKANFHTYLHKDHRAFAKTLSKTLDEMKQDGTYDLIYKQTQTKLLLEGGE